MTVVERMWRASRQRVVSSGCPASRARGGGPAGPAQTVRVQLAVWAGLFAVLAAMSTPVQAQTEEERRRKEEGIPVPLDPVAQVKRQVSRGDYDGAIYTSSKYLSPDSSFADMRHVLGWSYVSRDRVCLPVPPSAAGFAQGGLGQSVCDVSFLPDEAFRQVETIFREEERLAPDRPRSFLLLVDFYLQFGTAEDVTRQLALIAPFDQNILQRHILGQVPRVYRPGTLGVVTEYLLSTAIDSLDCQQRRTVMVALLHAGNMDGALRLIAAGADVCRQTLLPIETVALLAGGLYEELWALTKNIPADWGTGEYYRYMLTSVAAAAHFDTAHALRRLDHEAANRDAYPEPAQEVLDTVRRLLTEGAATADDWADLAEREFLGAADYAEVRDLLHGLALRLEAGHPRSISAIALAMNSRRFPLIAAPLLEEAAGGLTPELSRRWDPHRPQMLRLAAANYFLAEDYVACLEMLDELSDHTIEDVMLLGAAAVRVGDPERARAALGRVRVEGTPEMIVAAERLLAMAAPAEDAQD